MKYFAAIQSVLSVEKADAVRSTHVEFLEKNAAAGHIYAWGRFQDGAGGLTIYHAESLEAAKKLAESDPFVIHGARRVEVHEWAMHLGS
jgi:uncharacterized protein